MRKKLNEFGFTLIEMMIVVVIIALLAGIALVSYSRYIKRARLVEAKVFISMIQAQQESYFQQHGTYVNASGSTYYPALSGTGEPVAKRWNPTSGLWGTLGARPESGATYFQFRVTASTGPAHATTVGSIESALGIPDQPPGGTPHPWYYIVARGNLDGQGTCDDPPPLNAGECTMLYTSSARAEIVVQNESQ